MYNINVKLGIITAFMSCVHVGYGFVNCVSFREKKNSDKYSKDVCFIQKTEILIG